MGPEKSLLEKFKIHYQNVQKMVEQPPPLSKKEKKKKKNKKKQGIYTDVDIFEPKVTDAMKKQAGSDTLLSQLDDGDGVFETQITDLESFGQQKYAWGTTSKSKNETGGFGSPKTSSVKSVTKDLLFTKTNVNLDKKNVDRPTRDTLFVYLDDNCSSLKDKQIESPNATDSRTLTKKKWTGPPKKMDFDALLSVSQERKKILTTTSRSDVETAFTSDEDKCYDKKLSDCGEKAEGDGLTSGSNSMDQVILFSCILVTEIGRINSKNVL